MGRHTCWVKQPELQIAHLAQEEEAEMPGCSSLHIALQPPVQLCPERPAEEPAILTSVTSEGDSCARDSRRKAGEKPPTCTLLPPRLPQAPGAGWKGEHYLFFFDIPKLSKKLQQQKSSRAMRRLEDGHCMFICHKFCLGEH